MDKGSLLSWRVVTARAQVLSKFKVANGLEGFEELCRRVDQEVWRWRATGAI